jgi:hypothetical protein
MIGFTSLETNIPNYKVNEEASNSTKPVSKDGFFMDTMQWYHLQK